MTDKPEHLEAIEIQLLLEGIYQRYGYDFRQYARASLTRRVRDVLRNEGYSTVSGLQEKALHDPDSFQRLLLALTVNVSAMFRDPSFFLALRTKVIPILRTYPYIRVWCAGCSNGEEAYSLAILLEEEGLYERARIYATDLNDKVLAQAKAGIFPLRDIQEYTRNYQQAGGARSFSELYTAAYDHALFLPSLKRNILFAQHNLVSDASFNEFQLILCRNVMIYFNRELQARVHSLLHNSLAVFGILGLGDKESMRFTPYEKAYERLDDTEKLYRRVS